MLPLADFPETRRRDIRYVLADIDDTITTDGLLTAAAFAAMERLASAGLRVIPITGRPGGWCDHIARMWPVAGVVGENGAFYFRYDRSARTLQKRFVVDAETRAAQRAKLKILAAEILAAVPGSAISADQPYREADLAIDYREDVAPLSPDAVEKIKSTMTAAGLTAKISSIHVNGWFGDYDKLSTTRLLFREGFGADLDAIKDAIVFVGDSPNDAPMFRFFSHSVGVANVREFLDRMDAEPTYVTDAESGKGFAEVADLLLAARG